MLQLMHCAYHDKNKLAPSTYAPLSADNAGVLQEGTHPDHSGEYDN